ncbi:MAG: kelch repeat-containing protein [Sphingomonadaceae bacterium]
MNRRKLLASSLVLAAMPAWAQWTPDRPDRPTRPPAAPARFRSQPSLPRPVQEIYPTFFDARIIVGGGFEATGPEVKGLADLAPTRAVHAFRPGARAWERLPELPVALHHPFLIGFQGRLFCIGGFTSAPGRIWQMERRVWTLVRGASRWEEGPPLPRPQAEVVGGVVAGRLLIAAGRTPMEGANANYNDHGDTQDCWFLGPDLQKWEPGPRVPRGVNSAAASVINGRLHMVGGRYSQGSEIRNVADHQVFDPARNAWVTAPALPAPRGGHAAAVAGGRLFAFGGESFGKTPTVYPDVFAFDPRADQWSRVATMPEARHGLGAVGVAGRIHLLGGAAEPGGRATRATHEMFTP